VPHGKPDQAAAGDGGRLAEDAARAESGDLEFETRNGRLLTLPRITIPAKEQAALLMQLGWTLPAPTATPNPHPRHPDTN